METSEQFGGKGIVTHMEKYDCSFLDQDTHNTTLQRHNPFSHFTLASRLEAGGSSSLFIIC